MTEQINGNKDGARKGHSLGAAAPEIAPAFEDAQIIAEVNYTIQCIKERMAKDKSYEPVENPTPWIPLANP